ncbi:MAG: S1/P1 nuclease [Ferruginibacter sp.]
MNKGIAAFLFIIILISGSQKSMAWGKKGHELVAQIAFQFLDDSTKKIVKGYLGNLSIEEAANWMDDERSNSYYNYMRTWHYLDIDKGEVYKASSERNIITVLHSAIVDLRLYKTIKRKETKRDLLLIFHLMGDLHQPLHTGYAIDKGGNTIEITSPAVSGNLHSVWDTQIIDAKNITLDSCLQLYATLETAEVAALREINELKWMYQSRSLLDTVYSFKDNYLDQQYIDNNARIIKKQLVIAGIRLAAVLNEVFGPAKK